MMPSKTGKGVDAGTMMCDPCLEPDVASKYSLRSDNFVRSASEGSDARHLQDIVRHRATAIAGGDRVVRRARLGMIYVL